MIISIIAAVAKNRAIGYNNGLIYNIKEDLAKFKQITTGHTVIMGRNTYMSLPNGALPNRRNIVITSGKLHLQKCECFNNLTVALASCNNNEEVFIIGGEQLYKEVIGIADRLYITEVDDTPDKADTFFPDYSKWKETKREEHKKNESNKYAFAFTEYHKL
jgi:dihydrofolate reductase